MKSGGAAFTMDVVKPAKANKAAVIFMVSGGWISDHAMFKSMMPSIEKPFVDGTDSISMTPKNFPLPG